jgi:hypothetical protein
MATRRHGILHEGRGLNATEGDGALNLQALIRAPRVRTRTSATWSATQSSASLCENDEAIEMLRKESVLIKKED